MKPIVYQCLPIVEAGRTKVYVFDPADCPVPTEDPALAMDTLGYNEAAREIIQTAPPHVTLFLRESGPQWLRDRMRGAS